MHSITITQATIDATNLKALNYIHDGGGIFPLESERVDQQRETLILVNWALTRGGVAIVTNPSDTYLLLNRTNAASLEAVGTAYKFVFSKNNVPRSSSAEPTPLILALPLQLLRISTFLPPWLSSSSQPSLSP